MTGDTLTDVLYDVQGGLAWIVINRPDRYNAFRNRTIEEIIDCVKQAWADPAVGVIALTGAGDKAFSSGGDVKQRQATGDYGPSRSGLFELETMHRILRDVPKPVIAAVNGLAIGGGHVLHLLCDVTIASEHARFGQVGPQVGSFDAGFGTAYLARVVGEKRARQIWYLCEQYDAQTALDWGLVNAVVPPDQLGAAVRRWADLILGESPTALRVIKHSFNAASESVAGRAQMALDTLDLYMSTDEAAEGVAAFSERRPASFDQFR